MGTGSQCSSGTDVIMGKSPEEEALLLKGRRREKAKAGVSFGASCQTPHRRTSVCKGRDTKRPVA